MAQSVKRWFEVDGIVVGRLKDWDGESDREEEGQERVEADGRKMKQ
jgi:hypothetical protein